MESLKDINKLTLKDMIERVDLYGSLADDLVKLPVPHELRIAKRTASIPRDLDEFSANICYSQRLYFMAKEDNDFGVILRTIAGYFYPLITSDKWDDNKALKFGAKILLCNVINLYPVAMHMSSLIGELLERERKLLYREPSKIEIAAGIDKLGVYSELTSLKFLKQALGKTDEQVMLTPYNECLVEFMLAKEQNGYNERYMELLKEQHKHDNSKS